LHRATLADMQEFYTHAGPCTLEGSSLQCSIRSDLHLLDAMIAYKQSTIGPWTCTHREYRKGLSRPQQH
jgi:hypothetical protein